MGNQLSVDAKTTVPAWIISRGPFVTTWKISSLMPKPAGGVAEAGYVGLDNREAGWKTFKADPADNFVNVHARFGNDDGLVYLACRLSVATAGAWELALGHDGGARLFVDGACMLTEPRLWNPAEPARSCVRLPLTHGRHEVVVALDLNAGKGYGIFFQASKIGTSPEPEPVLISDLSICTPPEALSTRRERGRWKVLPYTAPKFSGKCVWAMVNTGAPELTLPLNAKGWHAIYLGLGSSGTEAPNAVRVKLSGDTAFQHRAQTKGACEEVLFKCADLTGQSLHIAQQTAGQPHAACVYYVKLLPLSDSEAEAVQRERRQRETKRLIGTIDGFSFLWWRLSTTRAELLEEFEPFRNTDFGTIWWCLGGADLVNYRSRLGTISGTRTDDFPRAGDSYFTQAVQTLIARGIDITKVAVEACHDMGISIHISMRPAAWKGPVPYEDFFISDFYDAHPEWRCRDRDGTSVTRMSFAVPEVRQHLLGIFREVLEAGPDGLNVLYNRGVPLILWEDAFCDRFRELHGEDARTAPEDDPRIYNLRAEFLTQWMREVRQLLDEFQHERGLKKRLALSAMCLETEADNRMFGLDVARWVREGMIDQIGVHRATCYASGKPIDLAWYKRITASTGVPVHPGMVAWQLPKADEVLRQAVEWENAGAGGLLIWDPGAKVMDGLFWPMISRLGHAEETRARAAAGKLSPVTLPIRCWGDEPLCRWAAGSGF